MSNNSIAFLFISSTFLVSCFSGSRSDKANIPGFHFVTAVAETKPVPRDSAIDAADDPAIWIHAAAPDSSRIIGTDKQGGLAVYDLSGKELYYYPTGKMNNGDIRYGFEIPTGKVDLLAVSNRTDHTVDIYQIHANGALEVIHQQQLKSQLKEDVYGLCMYHSSKTGKYFVFVNGKDGAIEEWELFPVGNRVSGKLVRNLKLGTQVEGMVADDENGLLFVGEEDRGIWKFPADPEDQSAPILLAQSAEADNPSIRFDLEGMAIYKKSNGAGYLIASSQGNSSYAIFERTSPHKYFGNFKIVDGLASDGTEETDGLEVTSYPLGNNFPSGLLVVQDGKNMDGNGRKAQNFKIVRWDSIVARFDPVLK